MVKKSKQETQELTVEELIALDGEDQSQTTDGDFERTLPPEGETLARFVEYVELGLQPQRPYMGKEKPPADEVNLVFELLSPDNIHEVTDTQGNTTQFNDRIYITVAKKLSGRAKFKKLFEAMKYGRDDIKHMKKMLGEAFIVNIIHSASKTNPDKIYANIGNKDNVGIRGPFTTNLKTRKQVKEDVPEATMPLKIFLQDNPTKASWDSLFIDGEYEKDGETKSKNFIQNKILASPSFPGSALEALLDGTDSLPELADDPVDDIGEEEEASAPVNAKGRNVSITKKPVPVVTQKPVSASGVKSPAGTVKSASPSKLNMSALTRPAAVPEKKVAKKKTSTKDAFAAIGLNVK